MNRVKAGFGIIRYDFILLRHRTKQFFFQRIRQRIRKITPMKNSATRSFFGNAFGSAQWTPTQLVSLGRALENAYGGGIMTADPNREAHGNGWTAQQLLAMSAAKSLYN